MRHVGRVNDSLITWMGAALIVVTGAFFVAAQLSISAVNGWWVDELVSLRASDVSLPFTRAFSEYIFPDSNPPLYYVVLYWFRWLITDDRTAIFAVNIAAIMIAGGAVLVASRRAGLSRLAIGGLVAFVLSGPVLLYVPEGRNYCLALAVVFVASWYAALAIEDPHQRPVLASFIALGAVAALTHVYAALFCGGLGAGLLTVALFSRRRDLVGPGVAYGLSASVVFVIWIVIWRSMGNWPWRQLGWIEFSPEWVFKAAWHVENIAVGWGFNLLLLILLLVFGMLDRDTRPFFIAFGVAFALFVSLPLIESLKHPIIVGRYWLVGAPALVTLITFAAWTWISVGRRLPIRRNMRLVAACGALLFLGASSIRGFAAAHSEVDNKMIWRGAKIVRPLLDRCPSAAIHVRTDDRAFVWGFSKTTGAPPSLFVDAKLYSTPSISPAVTSCPVLGWAEHIGTDNFMSRATDADILRFLKIEATPDDVDIRRHRTGFVVLKHVLSRPTSGGSPPP